MGAGCYRRVRVGLLKPAVHPPPTLPCTPLPPLLHAGRAAEIRCWRILWRTVLLMLLPSLAHLWLLACRTAFYRRHRWGAVVQGLAWGGRQQNREACSG